MRFIVSVNILTHHAVDKGAVKVFGGEQKRPNIHIDDMVDLYVRLLQAPREQIAGRVWNAGGENHTVRQLAELVRSVVGRERVTLETVATDDNRSYHISSERLAREFGFRATRTVEDAVRDL